MTTWRIEGNEMMMIELTPCDVCGDLMSADVHAEELGMCLECSNLYFSHDADGQEC